MRGRDSRAYLADAMAAAQAIQRFLAGRSFAQYAGDEVLRSAVERQFEIAGEALNRALKADSGLAERLPEAPKVIAFRNVLAHDYAVVVDETVYSVATFDIPVLVEQIHALPEELP